MTAPKFKGRYQIADGYVSGARPQYFTFYAAGLEDDMTDEEILQAYEVAAEDHMRENIVAGVEREDEFLEWAREQLSKREQEQS
jgi:hypothetical protein